MMKPELISQLHRDFESIVHTAVDSETEFWLARELQTLLAYARWENFAKVLAKATSACENAGYEVGDHFLDVRKMVTRCSCVARGWPGQLLHEPPAWCDSCTL